MIQPCVYCKGKGTLDSPLPDNTGSKSVTCIACFGTGYRETGPTFIEAFWKPLVVFAAGVAMIVISALTGWDNSVWYGIDLGWSLIFFSFLLALRVVRFHYASLEVPAKVWLPILLALLSIPLLIAIALR
jgi:hypothetical protein